MSSKIDKDMLKNPDVFISTSDKIFNFVEDHFMSFAAVVGLAVMVSLGVVTMNFLNARREAKAAESLYAPEAALKKAESDVREAHAKEVEKTVTEKDKKKADKAKPKIEDTPVDYAKTYAPAVESVKAAIAANANSKAALVSALNLSYFLTQQKQYKEALEVLQIPKFRPSPNELLGGFWYMHRGVIELENNNVDQAIEAYNVVVNSQGLKAFQPEALLKLGVCYELKGDAEKARATYEKVGRDFPETEASTTAQQYLRLLELNAHKQG